MNSKTRSTSQRALKSVSSKPARVDFIKKNKEQVSRLAKRNRSSSSSRSRKISPKNSTEEVQSQPHPKITNLKEARDRAKLQRISEAESASMSQEYEDFKRSKERVSYSQPLEIAHFEDVSTQEEGKQDRESTENRENRKEQEKLDIVQEENTGSVEIEEEKTKEMEKEVEGKKEEDLFLQTFGGSQGRESSSGKSQSAAIQAVHISYTQRHLTDYHLLSPKPILRSAKKEEVIKPVVSTVQEKQASITHYIPENKPQVGTETFYDAVDESFNPTEPPNPSMPSSDLDMALEIPLEISHANIINSQHSNQPRNPLISHQEESPLDMELEYPEPIQIPTPQRFSQSKPDSKPVFPSHSTPETSYPEISIPASRKKSISFDVPEPQMHSTPAHTPSYVHKATPFPHNLPHEMSHSFSQPYGHEASSARSEAYLSYSQQIGVTSVERKGVNLASLYNIPENSNQEKEDIIIPIPEPASLHKTPEPASLHKTPEPTSLHKTPEPASFHKTPEPTSLHKTPEPTSLHKTPEPTSLHKTPEPTSLHKTPEPASIQQTREPTSIQQTHEPTSFNKTPEPTNMHKTPETNKENMDPAFRNIKYDKMPMSEQIKRSARRVRITDTGEEIPDVTWTELKLKLSGAQPSEHAEMENIQISEFKLEDISHQEHDNIKSSRESYSQPPNEIGLHFTPDKTTISIQTSPVHSIKATPLRRSARLAAKRKNVFENSQPQESPRAHESPESAQSPESEQLHEPAEASNKSSASKPSLDISSSSEKETFSSSLKRKLKPSNFSEFDVPVESYEKYYGISTSSRKKMKYK